MIQIYYLTTPEREQRFRSLFDRLDVIDTFFPIASIPSLTAWISRNKAVDQQNFIFCDLTNAPWSDEHILSAVQTLHRFSATKFVFLATEERATVLYKHLAENWVHDLIIDRGDLTTELTAILTGKSNGSRRLEAIQQGIAAAALEQAPPLRIPAGLVIDVAVAGAMSRVGATSQTLALYHFFQTVGFRPALFDQGQDTYRLLRELCPKQTEALTIVTERTPSFDCYLIDHGVLSTETAKSFSRADLCILIGGGKPWELPSLANAYQLTQAEKTRELVTFLSFATEDEEATVRQFIPACTTVPYHPDIWSPGSDSLYRDTILPALRRICSCG